MENTPIDKKLGLSRRMFVQNLKKFKSQIAFLNMTEWAKNPSHATVHFYLYEKGVDFIIDISPAPNELEGSFPRLLQLLPAFKINFSS
jgi:hypothetical protein